MSSGVLDHSWTARPPRHGNPEIRVAMGTDGIEMVYAIQGEDLDSMIGRDVSMVDDLSFSDTRKRGAVRAHNLSLAIDQPPMIGSPVQMWDAQQRGLLKGLALVRIPRKPAAEFRFKQRARPQSVPLYPDSDQGKDVIRQQPWKLSLQGPPLQLPVSKVPQFWRSSSTSHGKCENDGNSGGRNMRPPSRTRITSSAASSRPPSAGSSAAELSFANKGQELTSEHRPAHQRPVSALPSRRPVPSSTRPSSAMARIRSQDSRGHQLLQGRAAPVSEDYNDATVFDTALEEGNRGGAQSTRFFAGGAHESGAPLLRIVEVSPDTFRRRQGIHGEARMTTGIMGIAGESSLSGIEIAKLPRQTVGETAEQKIEIDSKLEVLYGGSGDWFDRWRQEYEQESKSFQSLEIFCEIKMLEILNSNSLNAIGDPNRFKTAVVCDMLGRLSSMSGSLAGILTRIQTELMRSIYVDFQKGHSPFSLKPYFVEAAASAAENKDSARERDSLLNQLYEKDEKIDNMKKQIRVLREDVQMSKLDVAWTRTKKNNLELQLLQRPNPKGLLSEEAEDAVQVANDQLDKIALDLMLVQKLHSGAQSRVLELEHEVQMAKIRANSAEMEWKEASDTIDSLKRQICVMNVEIAKMKKTGVANTLVTGNNRDTEDHATPASDVLQDDQDADELLLAWVRIMLQNKDNTSSIVNNITKDFRDSHIYVGLFGEIFNARKDVRKLVVSVDQCISNQARADLVVSLCRLCLHCECINQSGVLGSDKWPHRILLLELLGEHTRKLHTQQQDHPELAKDLERDIQNSFLLRRRVVGELLVKMTSLESKSLEQAKALERLNFQVYDEEALMSHIQFSLPAESLAPCLLPFARNQEECQLMCSEIIDYLNDSRPNLRAVFRYYCKLSEPPDEHDLAEPSIDAGNQSAPKASFLDGLDTMDLDEFRKLLAQAKYSVPGLLEATETAFCKTLKVSREEIDGVGMGAIHFEECIVRMSALLAEEWSRKETIKDDSDNESTKEAEHFTTTAFDILENLVDKHILLYCDKLHQLDFDNELQKDGIPELWEMCDTHLKRVFLLYATKEAGTALGVYDFLAIMRDLDLTGTHLTLPILIEVFTMTQDIVPGSAQNETMSLDEFQEALSACAIYKDPSPYLSLTHKIQEFITGTLLPRLVLKKDRNSGKVMVS